MQKSPGAPPFPRFLRQGWASTNLNLAAYGAESLFHDAWPICSPSYFDPAKRANFATRPANVKRAQDVRPHLTRIGQYGPGCELLLCIRLKPLELRVTSFPPGGCGEAQHAPCIFLPKPLQINSPVGAQS
jgi:hypothetical protein